MKSLREIEKKTEISEIDLRRYVRSESLNVVGEKFSLQYDLLETWRQSSIPIIILISGAKGTNTAKLGQMVAKRLGISQIIPSTTITQVLRSIISPALAPELHAKTHQAHLDLRPIYSVLYDKVLIGFEQHTRFPSEAIAGVVKRAFSERRSLIIRGEHIVPRYISNDLIDHRNVVYVTLEQPDIEIHKDIYVSRYSKEKKEEKELAFESIRKIHDYLVEEAKNRGYPIVKSEVLKDALEDIYRITLTRLESIFPQKKIINNEFVSIGTGEIHS